MVCRVPADYVNNCPNVGLSSYFHVCGAFPLFLVAYGFPAEVITGYYKIWGLNTALYKAFKHTIKTKNLLNVLYLHSYFVQAYDFSVKTHTYTTFAGIHLLIHPYPGKRSSLK